MYTYIDIYARVKQQMQDNKISNIFIGIRDPHRTLGLAMNLLETALRVEPQDGMDPENHYARENAEASAHRRWATARCSSQCFFEHPKMGTPLTT